MADIRKRKGSKGVQYQVRFASTKTKSGYAYKTFTSLKDAVAFRDNSRQLKDDPRASDEVLTVADAVDKWLDTCETEGRDGRDPVTKYTFKGYRQRAATIKAYDWPKPLHKLTAPDVIEFRSWLLRGQSRDKAKKVLSLFHSTVLEMVTRGILTHDIAAGIAIRGQSRYDQPVQIPTENEIRELLSAADRLANSRNLQIQKSWRRYRPILYLAVDTGMRPQEYLVVARSNISRDGVEVDRALERGGYKISVTKTPAGRRLIDISPHVYDMISHYVKNYAADSDHDLAFPTATGHWLGIDNWAQRGFGPACIEAGLCEMVERDGRRYSRPRLKPYDLRHFYASMLIDQKRSLKRIQYLMGHKDIQTTLNVYGHLIERSESEKLRSTGLLASISQNSCGEPVA